MAVRVALVGCGGVARSHLTGWEKLESVEFVAMCDTIKEKADDYAAQRGCPAYYDVATMLEEAKPDLVDVCTRDPDHDTPTIECLKAGVPTMVEKPIYAANGQYNVCADDVPHGQAMVAASDKSGAALFMNFNYRFSPYGKQLKELIDSGELGEPAYMHCVTHLACWSHTIDLMRFFNGDVVELAARVSGPEDACTRSASLRFENGSVGTLLGTTQRGWQHDLLRIEYAGTQGYCVMRDIAGGLEYYPEGRRERVYTMTCHDGPRSEFQITFDGSMAAFAAFVGEGKPTPAATGLDGLRELEIDAGLFVAAERGEWINLREEFGEP